MNLLWIEDFGGGLIPNDDTLRSFFGDFIDLDEWDNDELNCIKRPRDLTKFCKQQSVHRIWLCRNYFDYAEFKKGYSIIDEVDVVVVDIRLNDGRHVNITLPVPSQYENKYADSIQSRSEFHENAGFYIFNDLIHLGFPAEKMCFMTGEKNSFDTFATRCAEIYSPKVNAFEKNERDLEKLRKWLKEQESDYVKLRRGIIEACNYLKRIGEDDLQFNQFIKDEDKKIGLMDLFNYIGVLENLLPLQEPKFKKHFYKLFVRTLAHEWESAEPKWLNKQNEFFAFSLTMKMLRNWLSHSNLFEDLTAQDVAYFFIINIRTMFSFEEQNLLAYEKILLNLFSPISLTVTEFEDVIGTGFNNRKIPLFEKYSQVLQATNNTWQAINFYDALNNLHRSNQNPASSEFFIKGLYQVFWFSTSKGYIYIPPDDLQNSLNHLRYQFRYFNYHNDSKDYLFELARHVYHGFLIKN